VEIVEEDETREREIKIILKLLFLDNDT